MPKLLMITGLGSARDLASGKKGAFYNTLEEFHKYWDRVDIICPRVDEKLKVQSLFGNVYLHISPWPLFFQPLFFIRKILELHKKINFDLMTVHEFPPFYNGIGARLLWQKIKVPYVLEVMHIPGYPKAGNLKEYVYRILTKYFIKIDSSKAKAVRVINKKETPDFLVKAGVPRHKLVYIPAFYVDLDIFKPTDVVKEYDLIFVGRLAENKGINLFLEAVKLLVKDYQLPVRALIVGDGPLKKDIKLKVENWKLKIDEYGWAKDQKEVAGLLNRSKILVMPSYNEGGPRVVIEAMACGVPVLATSVGLVPDLGSVVVKIDWNSEDIAKKAKFVLGDHLEYMRLKQEGLDVVRQFEKKVAIKNYAEKLKNLL
ncbi:MAG TPA: glycosyltransferase family 4 protein [Candidatus Paceibacterota bacterium]